MAQNLTLPTYRIEISPDDLQRLIANPELSTTYPAVVIYQNTEYRSSVKLRGASALRLPKHSWRVEFVDESPGESPAINLDAEYYDRTMIRDYLAMQLGRYLGLPIPDQRLVSLIINNNYMGIYLEVEPIDENFLDRRDLDNNEIFASMTHTGRGAPFLNDTDFRNMYEIQDGTQDAYDRLGRFLAFLHYASDQEIEIELPGMINIDNVLKYFAIQYAIGNIDGFAKNFHLIMGDDNRYFMVPWDCDGTFGNDWAGNWTNDYERLYFDLLSQQAFFRRAMELDGSRDRFIELVAEIGGSFFPQLDSLTDVTYEEIRNDVYQDTLKRASNEEFVEAISDLRGYFSNRAQALQAVGDYFEVPQEPQILLSRNYLPEADEPVTVSIITKDSPAWVFVHVIDSTGSGRNFQAFDFGEAGDSTANDGVFSCIINLEDLTFPLYYSSRIYFNDVEGNPFPRCGLYLQNRFPFQTQIIQINSEPPVNRDVEIIGVKEVLESSSFMIGLKNVSGRSVDLSNCVIAVKSGYQRTMLPRSIILPPEDTVWVTNHLSLMRGAFPDRNITGALYFQPLSGDTISLVNPESEIIAVTVLEDLERISDPISQVVINEINYNSSNNFDTGDWIEITTFQNELDLGGWRVTDSRDNNRFVIPGNTILSSGEYLVIARDPERLRSQIEVPGRIIGGFDFSFNNEADDIRLLDASGNIVDWVSYRDEGLWPEDADGDGATLELTNPALSNYSWQNWVASSEPNPHGTPGAQNGGYSRIYPQAVAGMPTKIEFRGAFPNPFNGSVRVDLSGVANSFVTIVFYDLTGREIESLGGRTSMIGSLSLSWKPSANVATGVYYARIDGILGARPLALLHLR